MGWGMELEKGSKPRSSSHPLGLAIRKQRRAGSHSPVSAMN